MVRIALDAGHGRHTPGKRTPDDEREWTFNDKVLRACAAKLNEYQNVEILRLDDPSGETDIPLQARTGRANAWKADVLVSIHHNASAGKWHGGGGVETYIFPTASTASKDIANRIHPRIVQAMGLRDRGVKTANFHVLRESRMPAVLTEGGFMDSTVDIHSLRSDTCLRKQGEAIAEGLAVYFKLVKKPVKEVAVVEEPVLDYPSKAHEETWKWATEKGFVNGERPRENITRQQLASILKSVYDDLNK